MSKTYHQLQVEAFMLLARQEVPAKPADPGPVVRKLRSSLMLEEVLETIRGLGFEVTYIVYEEGKPCFELEEKYDFDLVETIDGCCDVAVVTTGTLSACGVPDKPFQDTVDRNNLEKFSEGHSWREDGKLIKPPGHKPPDIKGILDRLNDE